MNEWIWRLSESKQQSFFYMELEFGVYVRIWEPLRMEFQKEIVFPL